LSNVRQFDEGTESSTQTVDTVVGDKFVLTTLNSSNHAVIVRAFHGLASIRAVVDVECCVQLD